MDTKFNVGDVVSLKGGGPKMTVFESFIGGKVVCGWFIEAELLKQDFNEENLEFVG